MSSNPHGATQSATSIPPDDPKRSLTVSQADDHSLPHSSLAGDTYTILLSGKDTAGRFCLIDMHVPPGGGPPPHRHDFEESFIVLEGEIEATFRGAKSGVAAGFASALLPARKSFSRKSAFLSPPAPPLRPNSMTKPRQNSEPKLPRSPQNTNRAPATWLKCARSTRRPKDLVVKVNDDFNNATIRASIWAS